MADLPSSIRVRCLHTPEMVRAEAAAMLARRPSVTPRVLMRLWLARSPFVEGVVVTEADLRTAWAIVGRRIGADALEVLNPRNSEKAPDAKDEQ